MRLISQAPAAANLTANVSTAQVFYRSSDNTLPAAVVIPGSNRLNGKKFTVRASGGVTTGTTSDVTISLYGAKAIPATPLTASNWTLIKASTNRSIASASAPWSLEAELLGDNVSGLLHGSVKFCLNNTLDAAAAVTNALTTVSFATEPCLAFVAVVTFGTANAGNLASLGELIAGY